MGKHKPKGKETPDNLELPGTFDHPVSLISRVEVSARQLQDCWFSGLMSQSPGISPPV